MEVTEKIDIHYSGRNYERARDKLKHDESLLKTNRELILRYLSDAAIGKTAPRRRRSRKVGLRGRLKYLYLLKVVARFFASKDLQTLSVGDIESFVSALDNDDIRTPDDRKYSEQTKADMKIQLIAFLRWIHGEHTKKFHRMTYWIDTSFKKKSVPSFDEEEIREMLRACNTVKQRVLLVCLFDGGFRIEEFLNIRNSDVAKVKGDAPYFRIRVRNEFSKTLGREVPLFWPESHDAIQQFNDSNGGKKSNEEVYFPGSYAGVRMMLRRIGNRVGKRLTPHMFRHSSATYYANQGLNEFQLNKRYGWSAGSDMGRHYVEQTKILLEDKRQVVEYESNKLNDLQVRLAQQEQANRVLQESIAHLTRALEEMKEELPKLRQSIIGLASDSARQGNRDSSSA